MSPSDPRASLDRALRAVRREFFLSADQRSSAHRDAPLPIGFAQTISQPSLVAFMTGQLAVTPHCRVLEIGTGSGYQTAILAELAGEVFTIERVPELAEIARRRLGELHYRNIHFRIGDGALGWPDAAPFDRVMVTAAATAWPRAWAEQLAPGGRIVAPIGATLDHQELLLVEKDERGKIRERKLCDVRFVPLVTPTLP